MRQLRFPRLDPIIATASPWRERPDPTLPTCRHPHDMLDGVTCTLDNGHRSQPHAAPRNAEVLRW